MDEQKPDESLLKSLINSLEETKQKIMGNGDDEDGLILVDEPNMAEEAPALKGLSFTALPPVVSEDYSIEYIYGSDNERAGQAYFDKEANTLTLYIHDGFQVGELNRQMVTKYLVRDHLVMPVNQIIPLNADPVQLRTCQYYTAPRNLLESSPVVESDHHEYDRGFAYGSCSHPEMAPNSPCACEQNQMDCRIYVTQKWKDLKGYHTEDDQIYMLQSTRKSVGFVHHRVVLINGEDITVVEEIPSSGESLEEDALAAQKHLDAIIEPLGDLVEATLEDSTGVKTRYYDYALSS